MIFPIYTFYYLTHRCWGRLIHTAPKDFATINIGHEFVASVPNLKPTMSPKQWEHRTREQCHTKRSPFN